MLTPMTELDHVWSQMLDDAAAKAGALGRQHVAEYLRLRATNDAIRNAGVGWLIDTLIELGGNAQRDQFNLVIEREEPHSFARGNSTMVGTLIRVRQGVRSLTLEAGWTRSPGDGIMQKGALAFARFSHFGMQKAGVEIRLVHGEDLPRWLDESDAVIETIHVQNHLDILLGP
jgi:hypothetical protein